MVTLENQGEGFFTYKAIKQRTTIVAGVELKLNPSTRWFTVTAALPDAALTNAELLNALFDMPFREKETANGHTIKVVEL